MNTISDLQFVLFECGQSLKLLQGSYCHGSGKPGYQFWPFQVLAMYLGKLSLKPQFSHVKMEIHRQLHEICCKEY